MRFLISSLAIAAIAMSLAACTGKSSSSSDQSNSTATSGAEATAAASSAEGTTAESSMGSSEASAAPAGGATNGEIPSYPGAETQASGSTSSMTTQNASGTVMSTSDSFDKVYAWYQKNMPTGSERAHITQPVPSAVFITVGPDKSQSSVSITTNGGKTVITIAHVKMKASQ
jgi:hypothetical protein